VRYLCIADGIVRQGVFRWHLKISDVFKSLMAACNLFQIVGVERLKECLLKLVVQKGIYKRFRLVLTLILFIRPKCSRTSLTEYYPYTLAVSSMAR